MLELSLLGLSQLSNVNRKTSCKSRENMPLPKQQLLVKLNLLMDNANVTLVDIPPI